MARAVAKAPASIDYRERASISLESRRSVSPSKGRTQAAPGSAVSQQEGRRATQSFACECVSGTAPRLSNRPTAPLRTYATAATVAGRSVRLPDPTPPYRRNRASGGADAPSPAVTGRIETWLIGS
ncbi:hypothetical protein MTO96_049517 [Rhipicephalus appendiculatus]